MTTETEGETVGTAGSEDGSAGDGRVGTTEDYRIAVRPPGAAGLAAAG